MMREPTIADLAIDVRDTLRKSELLRTLTEDHGRALFDTLRRHLPALPETDVAAVLLLTYRFLDHVPDAIRRRAHQQGSVLSEYWMGQYVAAVVGAAGGRLHTNAHLAATSTRRPVAAPDAVDHQAPADVPDHAKLSAWLDARQAEVEHDHRESWHGHAGSCYCDAPKPCEDRAAQLAAIEGLRALLAKPEQAPPGGGATVYEGVDAADRFQAWMDFAASNRPGYDHVRDISYEKAPICDADLRAVLAGNAQMRWLLGIGLDREQWDTIAEAEGRRYEGEQTNNTLVGYLAYHCEDIKAQRHILLDEIQETKNKLAAVTAERDTEREAAAGLQQLAQQAREIADSWSQAAQTLYTNQRATAAAPAERAVAVMRPADVPDEWLQAAFDAIGHSGTSDGDEQLRHVLAAVLPLYKQRELDGDVRAVARFFDAAGIRGNVKALRELRAHFAEPIAALDARDTKAVG